MQRGRFSKLSQLLPLSWCYSPDSAIVFLISPLAAIPQLPSCSLYPFPFWDSFTKESLQRQMDVFDEREHGISVKNPGVSCG